jgi:phospholipid/cholesterol/gamma-HCH transport system substrate-binding protein
MKKYSRETVVGIFVVIGLISIGFMTMKLGKVGLLGDDTYTLFARFAKVTGLRVGNPVKMLGLEIGKVAGFKIDQENMVAVAELKISNDIEVFDDAIASIKTEGLIGDMYVALDVGGGGDPLKSGDTIVETEPPFDLQELIGKYAFGDAEK